MEPAKQKMCIVKCLTEHDEGQFGTTFAYDDEDRAHPERFAYLAATAVAQAAYTRMRTEKIGRLVENNPNGVVRKVKEDKRLRGQREMEIARAMQVMIEMCETKQEQELVQLTTNCLLKKEYPLELRHVFVK